MNHTFLRKSFVSLTILIFCFVGLYYHVMIKLVMDWSSNDNYSHGVLIPLIAGFLIWHQKKTLSEIKLYPSNAGLLILGSGLLLLAVGNIGAELFTIRLSMIPVLLGLTIYLGGWGLGKLLLLPVGYLIFMIPIPAILWNKIAFPLKLFATKFSVSAIQWLGIAVYREGNIIHLANTTLQVVDACSGLRSLTSLLALSGFIALLARYSSKRKIVLFLSAIPVAILVNIIRLVITAVLAEHYDQRVAEGFLHDFSGILVFLLALLCLYGVHSLLEGTSAKSTNVDAT